MPPSPELVSRRTRRKVRDVGTAIPFADLRDAFQGEGFTPGPEPEDETSVRRRAAASHLDVSTGPTDRPCVGHSECSSGSFDCTNGTSGRATELSPDLRELLYPTRHAQERSIAPTLEVPEPPGLVLPEDIAAEEVAQSLLRNLLLAIQVRSRTAGQEALRLARTKDGQAAVALLTMGGIYAGGQVSPGMDAFIGEVANSAGFEAVLALAALVLWAMIHRK